jgi:prepilin-type N-terminal cleavage/methylation domain-containing protein
VRLIRATLRAPVAGFSLVELAIVLAIVGLLMMSLTYTLSAQVEQRNFEDTRRRLDQARELVLAFAIVNGRLPCPARSTSAGAEVRVADTDLVVANRGKCQDAGGVVDYYGGAPGGAVGGLLPAATIGYQQVDSAGFAVDAWQNRIRYVVANLITNCSGSSTTPHFTNLTNLRANGITCQPNDLLVCKSANLPPAITATTCGGAANQIMSQSLVAAIIYSTGKNFATAQDAAIATAAGRIDESANLNGDRVFVYHTPTPGGAANGEFDDQFTWISVGEFYGKLIAAGVLP